MSEEYTLQSPIVMGDETILVITLDEPTVGLLDKFDVDLSEDQLTKVSVMKRLVCACAVDLTVQQIDLMKLKDLTGVIGVCASFFE